MIMKIVVFVVWPTGRVYAMPVCIDIRWPFQHAVHIYCHFSLGTKLLISVDVAGLPSITVGFFLENVTWRKLIFNTTLQLSTHHILAE